MKKRKAIDKEVSSFMCDLQMKLLRLNIRQKHTLEQADKLNEELKDMLERVGGLKVSFEECIKRSRIALERSKLK